mmetsp:Transcript_81735/g.210464  ORF Transcript_81735/g.210464 Transcript_81735/m.210464 type:complete len:161 (-) Transcript_81735:485-967(-)
MASAMAMLPWALLRGHLRCAVSVRSATGATGMQGKKVLIMGLKAPEVPASEGGLSEEKLAKMLEEQTVEMEQVGLEARILVLDPAAPRNEILATVMDKLDSEAYDCVSLGAHVRTTPETVKLFEQLVNVVHKHAPQARIAFDEGPDDIAAAIFRQLAQTE